MTDSGDDMAKGVVGSRNATQKIPEELRILQVE
jgi:hypothetical protein